MVVPELHWGDRRKACRHSCATHSGSVYHNYKQFYSIVLLAVVDANYKFILVDVGSNGRACDAGVYAKSEIVAAVENNTLHIPPPHSLPGTVNDIPISPRYSE